MDPMKKLISSFMLDVENYLSFVADYGKPNHKYFNFVLNKIGLMQLFLNKSNIFPYGNNAIRFINGIYVSLKDRFLKEAEKSSQEGNVKQSAIIFLLCKIFFTDDIGNHVKLRIVNDEWNVFVLFINSLKKQEAFKTTIIMFYHLFDENFFKFTMKNKALALDYGEVDNKKEVQSVFSESEIFWNDIRKEIHSLEINEIATLIELKKLRDEAMEPFEMLFPDRPSLQEALEEFETLKEITAGSTITKSPPITRRQGSRPCKAFQNSPGTSSAFVVSESEDSESESNTKTKMKGKKAVKRKQRRESSSSESEDEKDFKQTIRDFGCNSQTIMKSIGAEKFSEKLKRYYGKTE